MDYSRDGRTFAEAAERRARQIGRLFRRPQPQTSDAFSSTFLARLSLSNVNSVIKDLVTRYGAGRRTSAITRLPSGQISFRVELSSGHSVPVRMRINRAAPHRIEALSFENPIPASPTFTALAAEMRELPGLASFLISRLTGTRRTNIAELDPTQTLAIGSTFKLYILAELMRTLARGERRWTQVTRLSEGAVSLPSGVLHRVPIGAPVTLHTLAALMVVLSDNTAADQLLRVLGRDRIEAVMEVTGHARPASNTPFLSTRELFVLKAVLTESQAREYGRSPTQVRRRIVRATAKVDLASVTALQPTRPTATQTIEWFASASDLVNLLAWIHAHSKSAPAAEVLRLLAATPGFDQVRTRWRYFGFKGGSEPGVMNLTFLLQHPRGAWYAASAGWNDGNACLDEPKFAALLVRALELLLSVKA